MKRLFRHGGSRTAWALPAVVAAAVSAGCASPPGGSGGAGSSCAYVVEYDGRRYLGGEETDAPLGEPIGTATLLACDDTPGDGDDGAGPRPLAAYAVEGVDPGVAVAVAEGPGDVRLVTAGSATASPPGTGEPGRDS
ncbi:DUF6281 family protein [Streptomyces glaucus]|uniref:Secreted protein n=1 Tax=Streptomyces glaucus TaxID=284029 RepID=A0ABP5W827_9ACTN